MERYIFNKNYFGREYSFVQVNIEQRIDLNYVRDNNIDGFVIITDNDKKVRDIRNISEYEELRSLNLNSYCYESLNDLLSFRKLEYLKILGKSNKEIPFSSLNSLWCLYLNYDEKTCKTIFDCEKLEYIFIDNYTGTSSKDFEKLRKAKRIGLMKSKVVEFNAIKRMPELEHIGIGYNSNMESIKWLECNDSLLSIAFQNCKNIKNWEMIGSLKRLERLILDNCADLPSLSFLEELTNLKEIRLVGSTTVKDGKIKELMKLPKLNHLSVPVKKDYDITFQDLSAFNNLQ